MEKLRLIFFILTTISASSSWAFTQTDNTKYYCQFNKFNATCPPSQVAMMTSARYGRMRKVDCLNSDQNIGCSADVLTVMDGRCSGLRSCTVAVPDEQMSKLQPCPPDMVTYMEADYECVTIQTRAQSLCHNPLLVDTSAPGAVGYLASVVSSESPYGTSQCPWVIRVQPGLKVRLTLYDFGVAQREFSKTADTGTCKVYATVKEPGTPRLGKTICGGLYRTVDEYLSESNNVEVTMMTPRDGDQPLRFLIKYEAVGCVNPVPPANAWFQRQGDNALIACNYTSERWHIICKDSQWLGGVRNCSASGKQIMTHYVDRPEAQFPYGLLLSVVIGVVLGVILGTSMLMLVLTCRRRSLRRKNAAAYEHAAVPGMGGAYMYPPSDTLYGDPSLKYAGLKTGNYAHIWELKHHQHHMQQQQHHTLQRYPTSPPLSAGIDVTNVGLPETELLSEQRKMASLGGKRDRAHFYESPRFDPSTMDNAFGVAMATDFGHVHPGGVAYCPECESNVGGGLGVGLGMH